MARAHASPWLETLTAEFNANTWMYLAGDARPVITRQGSRPGSSWADLFYSVTVPRILACRDSLRPLTPGAPGSWSIRWDGLADLSEPTLNPAAWTCETSLDDVVWADDLAKCIPVPDAADVGRIATREAGLLTDAFAAHGYSLSFGPAKTAAVIAVRGPGSRKVRRALFGGTASIPILREDGGAAQLPLVAAYRHLGVQIAADGGITHEIKHRAALAWAAFRQGRTRVFRSRRIALIKRGALLASHVLTKLLFAVGAWPALGKGEHALFSHSVLSLYRQTLAIGPDGDQHLTHATVCSLLQQPPPAVLLLVEHARYLLQLFHAAPVQLWALIRRDAAYVRHLRAVLSWLYGWLRCTTTLPDPLVSWEPWQALIDNRPGLFRAYVKRARGLEMAKVTGVAALQALRRAIAAYADGDVLPAGPTGMRYEEGCLQCKIAFPNRTAWACHASKIHGYRAAATLLASEVEKPACMTCGKVFANKGRLQRHLMGSSECRIAWGSFHPAVPVAQCTPLHSQAPPARLEGTLMRREMPFDPAKVHLGLLSELQAATVDGAEGLWETVCSYIAPLETLRHTVAVWGSHPGHGQSLDVITGLSEDLQLLLDVELWCEDFRAPKQPRVPLDCCPPLAPLSGVHFGFHLVGALQVYAIDAPPTRDFCYPFQASVPLSSARRTIAWLEAACDTVGLAVQATQFAPVLLRASPHALAMLEPATSWLRQGGFILVSDGLRTPFG